MSISLKVGEIDPPSIITDIINLPDPVKLGITITAYNYDDVGLYFKIDAYNAAWTGTTVNLGLIASGGSLQSNLDQFASRARPAAETAETLTLRLRAYTDAGYTILKWTYLKTLDVLFIKSDDGSWTQDFLNNFDDGTVQGWAAIVEAGAGAGSVSIGVATDYVLSPAYSLKTIFDQIANKGNSLNRFRIYKTFATPNRPTVYAIIDIRANHRQTAEGKANINYINVQRDGTVILFIGDGTSVFQDYVPIARWIRLIVPLPTNTSVDLRIVVSTYMYTYFTYDAYADIWMDDFRIISK